MQDRGDADPRAGLFIVREADGEGVARLWRTAYRCAQCGALVVKADQGKHEDFHASLVTTE